MISADYLLKWISKKSIDIFQQMHHSYVSDEKWDRLRGSGDILEELRLHILQKNNPCNRKDIKKLNEKIGEDCDN